MTGKRFVFLRRNVQDVSSRAKWVTVVMWLSRDFELHWDLKERCGDHSATGQESEDGLFLSPNFVRLNDPTSSLMCSESHLNGRKNFMWNYFANGNSCDLT